MKKILITHKYIENINLSVLICIVCSHAQCIHCIFKINSVSHYSSPHAFDNTMYTLQLILGIQSGQKKKKKKTTESTGDSSWTDQNNESNVISKLEIKFLLHTSVKDRHQGLIHAFAIQPEARTGVKGHVGEI